MAFILPPEIFHQHTAILGKTGSGKSSAMRLMAEHLLSQHLPVCIIDPKGDWWGLKLSADGKGPGYPVIIFGGEHADVPISRHSGASVAELVATGNRPCIIDLGGWMPGDRAHFAIDFASTLFRASKGKRFLFVDECHNFAPQGKVMDPDAGKMLHWFNRLASEGRGKGITIMAASQRPQKVHKDFLTCAETLICMRLIHVLDRNAAKDWMDGAGDKQASQQVLDTLAGMPRGEAWVWSPEIKFGPKRIAFPMFKTYDSFAPQSHEAAGKLKGWAEVDLEEVKAKLAATIEEKKANDPAELKRQIAELQRQLKARPTETTERIVEKRVEVPALKPDELARLESAAEQFHAVSVSAGGSASQIRDALRAFTQAITPAANRAKYVTPASHIPPTRRVLARPAAITGGESLAKAERRILTCLAQYGACTKSKTARIAGYAVSGGGFNNAVGACASREWLTRNGEILEITDAGVAALGSWEALPTGSALVDYWLPQLPKAERGILEALRLHGGLGKEPLAEVCGYEPKGGGFNNALGHLRTIELISGRDVIAIAPELLGGGA